MDHQSDESEHATKRICTCQPSEDELPKNVVRTLSQGSNVMSMDFHPQQQTTLLVGTNVGEISLWEVETRERLAHNPFKIWDISACTMPLQAAFSEDAVISVNRCIWSQDGLQVGVAFSKHIVQLYTYNQTGHELRQHFEIDAHIGSVNDIAFARPKKQLLIITCGDDRTIKVWDVEAGHRKYIFEGHEAPVYSVCPHYIEHVQFILSNSIDGKIKGWLYDHLESKVDHEAHGFSCTKMAYSADGKRLFSCGISKESEPYIVELNESTGEIIRRYFGFSKHSLSVLQFDTMRNRFLAAGDEFHIKFWDMDNPNILTVVDADGGLPASPRLRFNKEGSLLAVTANDNGIKILASNYSLCLIRMLESSEPIISKATMESSWSADVNPWVSDYVDRVKSWKFPDILDPSQLKALRLRNSMTADKIVQLIYTNFGRALLALDSNAVHKLWKWWHSQRNPSGEPTAYDVPHLCQPSNGTLLTNDITKSNAAEESAACIALSIDESYIISTSGGKVSMFNMITLKVVKTFTSPPPAATFLEFHPQDSNIIAIGMEDSTIQIYNVHDDEIITKLEGHQKQITGLAFSYTLNILVSSGADAKLCLWSTNGWEKKKSTSILAPAGCPSPLVGDTKVHFHSDQTNLLVVHESQIAVYDSKLECLHSWSPKGTLTAPISCAIYSYKDLLVYAGFCDGAVAIFDADRLSLRHRIAPSAYIPSSSASGYNSGTVYPLVVAAHPFKTNQIALGMSDGAVYVVEPSDGWPKPSG